MVHDPHRDLAVPQGRNLSLFPFPGEEPVQVGLERCWISTNQFVSPQFDGLWPFRIIAQGEARNSEDGRFFWSDWPANLEFHGEGRADRVTLRMPGMGTFEGRRADS